MFEKDLQDSCKEQKICFVRFKDSNKFDFGENTRFTPENPCDAVIYSYPNVFFVEQKTTVGTSLGFNQPPNIQPKGQPKPAIKAHQVQSLLDFTEYDGSYAGLLINFEDRKKKNGSIDKGGVYFIEINDFMEWAEQCNKKSINKYDAAKIGLEVNQRTLKIHKRFDVRKLLRDIVD